MKKDKERYNREMKEFLDNIRQEMQDEKKVKTESCDVVKEEKEESLTKEEQPKDDKKETTTASAARLPKNEGRRRTYFIT